MGYVVDVNPALIQAHSHLISKTLWHRVFTDPSLGLKAQRAICNLLKN